MALTLINKKWSTPLLGFVWLLLMFLLQPHLSWSSSSLYIAAALTLLLVAVSPARIRQRKALLHAAVSVLLIGIFIICSTNLLLWENHRDVSGIHNLTTQSELPALDTTYVPLVSRPVALTAMQRTLGEDLGLSSMYEVGEATKQVVAGRLAWVAPLEPRSSIKAILGEPSPGYVIVEAHDVRTARYVKQTINTSNREFFSLDTRAWFHNPTQRVHSWQFEIDDNGHPFWVAPIIGNTIRMENSSLVGVLKDVTSVLVVDAQTNVFEEYSLAQLPEWVDTRFPIELLADQVDSAGAFVQGILNYTQEGMYKLSASLDMVMSQGQPWYLGTLSSISRDGSITEAVMINALTKEAARFQLQGITESVGAKVLELKNPEKNLRASNPVPFMVNGIPAYVAALADSQDVVQAYGIVAINDAQVGVVAETLPSAVLQFNRTITQQAATLNSIATEVTVIGDVVTIRQDARSTNYYLRVASQGKHVLINAEALLGEELHVTQAGDKVSIIAKKSEPNLLLLATEFHNITLNEQQ